MCIETINLSAPRTGKWPIYSQREWDVQYKVTKQTGYLCGADIKSLLPQRPQPPTL